MSKNNRNVYIALAISVALLGAVIAVNYFYGWDQVYKDIQSMGKSVWFAFSEWLGVKTDNVTGESSDTDKIVVMPEELAQNETIVQTGVSYNVSGVVGHILNITERAVNRITQSTMNVIQQVNVTELERSLSNIVGTGVEFVNMTLETGREVLAPIENRTRLALGDAFDDFIAGMREQFETFFSSDNIQYIIQSIIEIPQSIILSIRNMLSNLSGYSYDMPATSYSRDVDAVTGAF